MLLHRLWCWPHVNKLTGECKDKLIRHGIMLGSSSQCAVLSQRTQLVRWDKTKDKHRHEHDVIQPASTKVWSRLEINEKWVSCNKKHFIKFVMADIVEHHASTILYLCFCTSDKNIVVNSISEWERYSPMWLSSILGRGYFAAVEAASATSAGAVASSATSSNPIASTVAAASSTSPAVVPSSSSDATASTPSVMLLCILQRFCCDCSFCCSLFFYCCGIFCLYYCWGCSCPLFCWCCCCLLPLQPLL